MVTVVSKAPASNPFKSVPQQNSPLREIEPDVKPLGYQKHATQQLMLGVKEITLSKCDPTPDFKHNNLINQKINNLQQAPKEEKK